MSSPDRRSHESTATSMNRRRFLHTTATVAATTALAGCGDDDTVPVGSAPASGNSSNATNSSAGLPAPVSNPNQYASAFKNVVNMVEAGADPKGNEDVSPVIQREIGSDTLLVFPKGVYKMNSQVRRVGLRNIGIIGQGAVLRHGKITAIDGFDATGGEFTGPAQHFKIGIPDNPHRGKFVFGGFIADWCGKNTGIQILNHHTDGTSVIENVQQRGMHDLGCQGPFRIDCHGPTSKALVKGIDLRYGGKSYQFTINTREERSGGGTEKGRSWATSGITTHPEAKGHLRVKNSACGGWPDNGFYVAGGPKQTVEVLNCVAANSHPSNIRISGTDCRIKNCTVVTDSDFDKKEFYFEQRPVRLDGGSCTVENVRIKQILPTGWSVTVQHAMEQATLKNINVEIHKQAQLALVVDDAVNQCTVNGFAVRTKGWHGTKTALFRGWPDVARNISINGRSIA